MTDSFRGEPGDSGSSLYVTLHKPVESGDTGEIVTSLSSPLYFPSNLYEVGLVSLAYNRAEPTPPVSQTAEEKDTSEPPYGPIFPNYVPPVVQNYSVTKDRDKILMFVMDLRKALSGTGVMFTFIATDDKLGKVIANLRIDSEKMKNKWFVMSPTLARLLGFNRQSFTAGSYLGSEVGTQAFYEAFPKGKTFPMKIVEPKDQQNVIKLYEELESIFPYLVATKPANFKEFFPLLITSIFQKGFIIDFSFTDEDKAVVTVQSAQNRKEDYIVLPEALLKCLGFDYDKFYVGTHYATIPFVQQHYDEIQISSFLWFRFSVYYYLYLPMAEPSDAHLDTVIAQLNETFLTEMYPNYPIQFAHDQGYLKINDIPASSSVILPYSLCRYFGFPDHTEFKQGSRLRLRQALIKEEEEEEYEEESGYTPSSIPAVGSFTLVTTGFTANQIVGNRLFPVLRVLDSTEEGGYKKNVRLDFQTVVYVPVVTERLQQLRVRLVDEYDRPVLLEQGSKLTVQLHFRNKN